MMQGRLSASPEIVDEADMPTDDDDGIVTPVESEVEELESTLHPTPGEEPAVDSLFDVEPPPVEVPTSPQK